MKVFRKEKEITLGPYKLLDFLIKQPKRVYSIVRTCLGR